MNIIWPNIAGSGQVYAQREGRRVCFSCKVESESRRGGNYCATQYFKGIYCEMRAYTGYQLSYLWSVREFPLELLYFQSQVSECRKQTSSAVSQKFKTISWLYKQIDLPPPKKKIRGQNCRASRLGD